MPTTTIFLHNKLHSLTPIQATLHVGGRGERLCQCKTATLTTLKPIPVQVDGEPCKLGPSIINISRYNQVRRQISHPIL